MAVQPIHILDHRPKVWFPLCVQIVPDQRQCEGQPPLSDEDVKKEALALAEIAVRKAVRDEI